MMKSYKGPKSYEQMEFVDNSQMDLKMFTHIGDVPFTPIEDEAIEACADAGDFE